MNTDHDHLTEEDVSALFAAAGDYGPELNWWILHDLATCPGCRANCGEILDLVKTGELTRAFTPSELIVARERRRAEVQWQKLALLEPAERREHLLAGGELATWGLAERLCEESRRAASRDPQTALALAEDALALVHGPLARSRKPAAAIRPGEEPQFLLNSSEHLVELELLARGHRANALRAQDLLDEAATEFAACTEVFETEEVFFTEYRAAVLSLRASLELDRRQLTEALATLEEACEWLSGPRAQWAWDLYDRVELQRANVLTECGRQEAALAILRKVAAEAEVPRTRLVAHHNLIDLLTRQSKVEEAARQLSTLEALVARAGEPADSPRLLGIKGRLARCQGRLRLAAVFFKAARQGFLNFEQGYSAAVVSLELASIYFDQGRMEDVRRVARELIPIFEAKDIHREARKALDLFHQAAQTENVTGDLLSRLLAYLESAWGRPSLAFAGT